jgi:hypothetical protein
VELETTRLETGKWPYILKHGTYEYFFETGSMNFMVQEIEIYKGKLVALKKIRWSDPGLINTNDTTIVYGKYNNQ